MACIVATIVPKCFTISLISCACGLEAENGAKGVGEATTKSVVWSFIAIVILDLIFAGIFFYKKFV